MVEINRIWCRAISNSEGWKLTDSWTKKPANGRTVTYKIEGDKKSGFVYSAGMDGRDIKEITGYLKVLTRKDVEIMFAHYVAGG